MNKPEFLQIGAIVKVQHFYAEVVDVAVTEGGKVMVQVASPKGIWRNHPAEWLEYQEGQIVAGDLEQAVKSVGIHRRLVEKMLRDLEEMGERWGSKE
jgi:stage V sporulation protein SpoVS